MRLRLASIPLLAMLVWGWAVVDTALGDGGVMSLADQTEDDALRAAVSTAYESAPEWRKFADIAAVNGTIIEWGPLERGVGAVFRTGTNVVTANERMRGKADTSLLAAVVAHEIYHASRVLGSNALYCLQGEVDAIAIEAYVWSKAPRPERALTAYEDWEDELARKLRDGRLSEYVLLSPDYQRQCLGGVVSEPQGFTEIGGAS